MTAGLVAAVVLVGTLLAAQEPASPREIWSEGDGTRLVALEPQARDRDVSARAQTGH